LDRPVLGCKIRGTRWPGYRRRSTNPPIWETGVEVLAHFFEVMRGFAVLLKVNASFFVIFV
jgi:hypothetical protein